MKGFGPATVLVACALAAVCPAAGSTGPDRLDSDAFFALDGQLRGLIEAALEGSPQLESARSRTRSSRERIAQERALPDLQLSYRWFAETPETRVGPQEHMLEVSQGVPWSGKRRLQAQRAELTAAGRGFEAEDLERRLVADVKRVYFEAAYLQEALRVNEEERQLLRSFEGIALKRYSTGQGNQQSAVKVQTEISRLDDREAQLRQALDVVTRRMAERIGRSGEPLQLRPITLPLPVIEHDREALEAAALDGHPAVLALERRIDGERARVERRKLDGKPDFRFGVGYTSVGRREDLAGVTNPPAGNGDDILGLTVGVSIPLQRSRVRAGVAEAEESGLASRADLAAARERLRFEVQQASLRVDTLQERGRLYLEVIIPQAEESLASAQAAYATDRLGFLDLLDAERVLFQSRLAYHRLMSDLWIALTDLELAAARPIPQQEAKP